MTSGPDPVVLRFNAELGCTQGDLNRIRDVYFEDRKTPLEYGADSLKICDTEELQTTSASVPYDLERRYPACLVWRDHKMYMVRKSPAVCALPNNRGFVCDGKNAKLSQGLNAVRDSMEPVPPCSDELLEKFGFPS